MTRLRIGTRGSDLALWQAHHVSSLLQEAPEIVIIKTQGDEIQHLSLDKVEGKGFFTKEIEQALLDQRVDLAIHSYKDLPTEAPDGLTVAACPVRGPIRDVVAVAASKRADGELWGLPQGARVGTSSLRRKAQLLSRRRDLELVDLRGNVPTRFGKVSKGDLDAVVLAEAGLKRLGLWDRADEMDIALSAIEVNDVCPAPAQGALAIQVRADDADARRAVAGLHHPQTSAAVEIERALLARFGGGCHLPLGAHATVADGVATLLALVAAPDGSERIEATDEDPDPAALVTRVHRALVARGAEKYL